MTNQEAIEILREKIFPCVTGDWKEAVGVAISALQEQDSPKPKAESVQNVQNEDLISRKAAIDAMGKAQWAKELLMELPSAQPERKKGRWEMKPDPFGFFGEIPVCSECGCTTKMREKTKFCPHCGAQMEGQ